MAPLPEDEWEEVFYKTDGSTSLGPQNTNLDTEPDANGTLPKGVIIIIVVSVVGGIGVIALMTFCLYRQSRGDKKRKSKALGRTKCSSSGGASKLRVASSGSQATAFNQGTSINFKNADSSSGRESCSLRRHEERQQQQRLSMDAGSSVQGGGLAAGDVVAMRRINTRDGIEPLDGGASSHMGPNPIPPPPPALIVTMPTMKMPPPDDEKEGPPEKDSGGGK